MKNLFLCFCLVLSLCSFANGGEQQNTPFFKRQNSAIVKEPVANHEFPNIFRSIGNFFKRIFGKKKVYRGIADPPFINALTLSKTEIVATCLSATAANKISCPDNRQLVDVAVPATDVDDEESVFSYKVAAGKIIGRGVKVVWDLSGVEPGTYTITAIADFGRDWGISSRSTTITVKECPDCKIENE